MVIRSTVFLLGFVVLFLGGGTRVFATEAPDEMPLEHLAVGSSIQLLKPLYIPPGETFLYFWAGRQQSSEEGSRRDQKRFETCGITLPKSATVGRVLVPRSVTVQSVYFTDYTPRKGKYSTGAGCTGWCDDTPRYRSVQLLNYHSNVSGVSCSNPGSRVITVGDLKRVFGVGTLSVEVAPQQEAVLSAHGQVERALLAFRGPEDTGNRSPKVHTGTGAKTSIQPGSDSTRLTREPAARAAL